jgi:chemotaxis protein histidine kinase CheA
MDALLASLKSLDAADLLKVMKLALAETEKRVKGVVPRGRAAAAKKTGSMPKGVVPPQLRKPRAWVDFTLKHALENGWEAFTVYQTKKDKATGEKTEEEIEMPGSVLHDGAYIYEGSITDKTPAGRQLIHKDAMSLSKQRWAPKEKTGTHPELYAEFEASYVEEAVEVPDAASVASSAKKVVKVTAAEKAAAAEAKKAAKEAEKAEKKAAKEAEKEAKKAEKEAEKAAKKAEKEAEKAAKKAEKAAAKKPATKAPVPAAAVKKAGGAAAAAKTPAPVKAAAVVKAKPVAAAPVAAWSCPADGMVHPWAYKGKEYLRNSDNEVWIKGADGSCGEWQGVYLPGEDRIDDSVPEPEFSDEE